jgi:hypothetical protein
MDEISVIPTYILRQKYVCKFFGRNGSFVKSIPARELDVAADRVPDVAHLPHVRVNAVDGLEPI